MRKAPCLRLLPVVWAAALLGACGPERVPDVEVRVTAVAVDPSSNSPVIVLEEVAGSRKLPIWIGFEEARSIAAELEHERPIRPNTHDLTKRLIDRLEGVVQRVVVTELSEGIYFARIDLASQGRSVSVDARPSDAIAIALRFQAPLFVREGLFDESLHEVMGEGSGHRIEWRQPPSSHRQLRARSL